MQDKIQNVEGQSQNDILKLILVALILVAIIMVAIIALLVWR
jgi:heme/copper-type cytochrome/quinol oxidase subunit 2